MMGKFSSTIGAIVLATASLAGCGSDSDSSGPNVVEPGADINGTTQVELAELLTRGWVSVAAESNSIIDPANCDMGLSTDDFYLAPSWGAPGTSAAACSMDADQALVLSPAGLMCVATQDDGGASPECFEENWDLTSATVRVDGEVFDDWEAHVVDTELFPVSLVDGNIFEVPAEDTEMRARQVIFVFEDLPAGQHDIVLTGDFADGEFAGQLDLTLTVEG